MTFRLSPEDEYIFQRKKQITLQEEQSHKGEEA